MFTTNNLKTLYSNYRKLKTKWSCVACIRCKSSAEPKTKTYSHTILFPATKFPARSSSAIKEEIVKSAEFAKLYKWQRENLTGPEFVLHDGPPYANGDLHMGHVVNKIIKDINNRSQVLQGNKVHYVPGWDCHGLPIELKALQKAKKTQKAVNNPVDIRNIARSFALETVEKQKKAFESWGVMADWEQKCYLTLDKSYIKKQLWQFHKMYKKGLVYRALKPVYWSPSSRTALAEAELEYDPQYKSKEVYVTFPIENIPQVIQDLVPGTPLSAIIWTTTPWTLVANRAICYSPQLRYSIITLSSKPADHFIVGSGLIGELEKIFGVEIRRVAEFDGTSLQGTIYRNNLVGTTLPFLKGDHVTDSKGTGLVHTAPAHGPEDFLVALDNKMSVECNVDESGRYINLDPSLNGLPVLTEGQDKVIDLLGPAVIHHGTYVHSYPLDWRTKQPVILRASQQWFIDTAALKDKALKALDNITILPASNADQSRQGFRAQLEKRPYWCISRQRAWGVPIPALYVDDDVIVDDRIISRLCSLIQTEGPDVWWTCDVKELLPYDVVEQYQLSGKQPTKGSDIMDIWLDSGLSWQTLDGKKARLYSEGIDQLTGWFQASLLTSLALNDDAPYESIFVHGFVVDDKKRKMSKSIGNVIDPYTIIHGGKDKKNQPAYGVDTLRWWVASHATQHSQIVISPKLLEDCQSEVIRIRNILKYLLGVINAMEKQDFHQTPKLNYFDAYMVQESQKFLKQINENFNQFKYNHVSQNILFFISNKVSGLYCHCIKDRLYCSPKKSTQRLSAQLVMHTIFVSICKSLAPILPHLVEEAWQHHPLFDKPFHFMQHVPVLNSEVDSKIMETVLEIKRDVCVLAKNESLKKFSADITLNSDVFDRLNELNERVGVNDTVLNEILELSDVRLNVKNGGKWEIKLAESSGNQCLRCRKYNVYRDSDKCLRCEEAVALL